MVRLLARLTLAITWPQRVFGEEGNHAVAAQVYGIVSRFPACFTDHLA